MEKIKGLLLGLLMVAVLAMPAQGAAFIDTGGHWAEQDILKMASKGLIYGDKNGCFYPESFVSRQVAVALMIRLVDKEDRASQMLQSQNTFPQGCKGISDWTRGYLLLARQENIINDSELLSSNWSDVASREEVAVYLSRTLNLLPVVANTDKILQGFRDGSKIDRMKAPNIIPLIEDGIMLGNNGYFNPQQPVKRAELATLMKRADDKYLLKLIPRSSTGVVVSTSVKPFLNITVRSVDGQFSTLANTKETAVYRNQQQVSMAGIVIGDEVEYISDSSNRLFYAEVLPAGTNLNNGETVSTGNNTNTDNTVSYRILEGEVGGIDRVNSNISIYSKGYRDTYKLYPELLDRKGSTYYYDDEKIRLGDDVKLTVNNGQVIAIKVLDDDDRDDNFKIYKGTLDEVDERHDQIELRSVKYWGGSSWKSKSGSLDLEMDEDADIYDYDGDDIDYDDLDDYERDTVYLLYDEDEDEVQQLRVRKGSEKSYRDDIEEFNTRSGRDSFDLDDENKAIYYDDSTMVVADDELLDIDDLDEDEKVRVIVNRYNSKYYAVLVEMEDYDSDDDSDSEDCVVYQGKLDEVDVHNDELELKKGSVKKWSGSSWSSRSSSLELDMDDNMDIYDYDGDEIDYDDLDEYENDYAYLLYDEENEEIIKFRIKKGSEGNYKDDVDDINRNRDYLELNNKDIYFDDYTIVLENDEIQDIDDIREDDRIRVVTNRYGSKYYAVLVELDEDRDDDDDNDRDGDDVVVYRAELDQVDEDDEEIAVDRDTIEYLDEDGEWQNISWNKKLDVEDADIYYHRVEIDLDKLEDYEGSTVFFAMEENDDRVIMLRLQREDWYDESDEISEMNRSRDRFELEERNKMVYYDESTICVNGDDLIDGDDFYDGDEVSMIVEKVSSGYRAVVIMAR